MKRLTRFRSTSSPSLLKSDRNSPRQSHGNSNKKTQISQFDLSLECIQSNIKTLCTAMSVAQNDKTKLTSALSEIGNTIENIEAQQTDEVPMFVGNLFTCLKHYSQDDTTQQQALHAIKSSLLMRALQKNMPQKANLTELAPTLLKILQSELTTSRQNCSSDEAILFNRFCEKLKSMLEGYHLTISKIKLQRPYSSAANMKIRTTAQTTALSSITRTESSDSIAINTCKDEFQKKVFIDLLAFISQDSSHPVAKHLFTDLNLILDAGKHYKQDKFAKNTAANYLFLCLKMHVLIKRNLVDDERLDHRPTILRELCIHFIEEFQTKCSQTSALSASVYKEHDLDVKLRKLSTSELPTKVEPDEFAPNKASQFIPCESLIPEPSNTDNIKPC